MAALSPTSAVRSPYSTTVILPLSYAPSPLHLSALCPAGPARKCKLTYVRHPIGSPSPSPSLQGSTDTIRKPTTYAQSGCFDSAVCGSERGFEGCSYYSECEVEELYVSYAFTSSLSRAKVETDITDMLQMPDTLLCLEVKRTFCPRHHSSRPDARPLRRSDCLSRTTSCRRDIASSISRNCLRILP